MTKPGSAVTDKIVALDPLGVASSVSSLGFVPAGMGAAGSFKLASYDTGQWYDADLEPDGNGTFNVVNVQRIEASTLPSGSGPEGFVFVAKGSPEFTADSLLLSEYDGNAVAAYTLDANGDPIVSSRRPFITGLNGAEGAFIDPVTGDFLFSTFGQANTVIVVRGFVRAGADPDADRARPRRRPHSRLRWRSRHRPRRRLPRRCRRPSRGATSTPPRRQARSRFAFPAAAASWTSQPRGSCPSARRSTRRTGS